MKSIFKVVIFMVLVFFINGCNKKSKEEYKVVINNVKEPSLKLKGDFLEIFFETGFDNDLIQIEINGKKFEYHIKTNMSIGYADFIKLGKLSEFKNLSFSINKGKLIKVNKPKYNLIKVNYIKDSIVWIDFSNKFNLYK